MPNKNGWWGTIGAILGFLIGQQAMLCFACLVFLAHHLDDFMGKTDRDKMPGILAKTWSKMSEAGRAEALKLALPPPVPALLEQGLARMQGRG